jgi:hypothetical protein
MRLRTILVAMVAVASTLSLSAASARQLPPGSISHRNSQFWTWAGPPDWISVDSANGITIQSPDGRLVLDRGFNTTLCAAPGAGVTESVRAYFASARTTLRQSVRRARLDPSRIRQLPEAAYGPLYFRQTILVTGRLRGRAIGSLVQLDYSMASGPTYCYQRSTSRTALANGFRRSMRVLASVEGSLAFFGPGAPDEEPDYVAFGAEQG